MKTLHFGQEFLVSEFQSFQPSKKLIIYFFSSHLDEHVGIKYNNIGPEIKENVASCSFHIKKNLH
jgi:hypothetical protein